MAAVDEAPAGPPDWSQLIAEVDGPGKPATVVKRYIRSWTTQSKPALVRCTDEAEWVIKSHVHSTNINLPRLVVNERLVGLLAELLDAPVPEIALIDLPNELVSAEPELAHLEAGVCHGSRRVASVGSLPRFPGHLA